MSRESTSASGKRGLKTTACVQLDITYHCRCFVVKPALFSETDTLPRSFTRSASCGSAARGWWPYVSHPTRSSRFERDTYLKILKTYIQSYIMITVSRPRLARGSDLTMVAIRVPSHSFQSFKRETYPKYHTFKTKDSHVITIQVPDATHPLSFPSNNYFHYYNLYSTQLSPSCPILKFRRTTAALRPRIPLRFPRRLDPSNR